MNYSEKKTRVIIMLIILQYWYRLRYKVLEREDTGKKPETFTNVKYAERSRSVW